MLTPGGDSSGRGIEFFMKEGAVVAELVSDRVKGYTSGGFSCRFVLTLMPRKQAVLYITQMILFIFIFYYRADFRGGLKTRLLLTVSKAPSTGCVAHWVGEFSRALSLDFLGPGCTESRLETAGDEGVRSTRWTTRN